MKNRNDYNTTDILETKSGDLYVYQNYVRPKYGEVPKADFFLGKIIDDSIVEINSPFSKELQAQPYQLYFLREDLNKQIWIEGHFAGSVEKLSSVSTELKIFNGSEWIDPPASWNVPKEQLNFVGELDNGAYYLTANNFYNFNGTEFITLSDSTDELADFRILKGASVVGTMNNIQSGDNLYIRLRGRGLVIFDGKYIKYLTPRNSIIPTDIHNPVVDHLGNVFFGSHAGGVKIREDKVSIYYDDEKIAAGGATTTAMDMNGNIVKFYTGVGIALEKQIKRSNSVKISSISVNENAYYYKFPKNLSHSENSLLFNYSVLNFSSPDQTTYEHTLDGYDKEWSRASNLSFTEYQNLPPGNYTFKVRTALGSNEYSNEATYSFVISPPFWRTWWAYLFYIFTFFGFLYSIRKFELKRQKKNTAIKESQLRAEAAEAQARAIEAENQRKTQELEEARKLQLSMLPKEIPQLPNLDIAVYMKTATEVGGDYYDFHFHLDGTLTVVLGDATGHGMQSGMMVSIMKSLFMSDRSNKELKPFLRNSNQAIKDMHLGRLMMALTCVQVNSSKITVANAGMPSTLVYRQKTNSIEELAINNMPLGGIKDFDYDIIEEHVFPGDTILMLSDGFPELLNDNEEMFGYERIKENLLALGESSAEEIIESFKEAVNSWSGGKVPEDDVTFAVIKVK
jgi:serine phosphatase RsbU (regulator of sigma subunit)